MARQGTRRSEQDEKVIDPFNAPDPIMPHDEPDLAGVYDPIVSPDEDTDNAFRSSKDRTVGTKKDTHTWHDPSYTAPTYEAPEVQETPASKPLPRRRHRKRYANPSPVPQHRRKTANRIFRSVLHHHCDITSLNNYSFVYRFDLIVVFRR